MPSETAENLEKSAFCVTENGGSWPERRTSLKRLESQSFSPKASPAYAVRLLASDMAGAFTAMNRAK